MQPMSLASSRSYYVRHGAAPDPKLIRDELPVAAPGNGFGTHNRHSSLFGRGYEPLQRRSKRFGLGVVCVSPEAGRLPPAVRGILAGSPPAPEIGLVQVANSDWGESGLQRTLGEVGMSARRSVPPHVDQEIDLEVAQELQELLSRTGGVPYAVDHLKLAFSVNLDHPGSVSRTVARSGVLSVDPAKLPNLFYRYIA